jgi:hypothetical protein
VSAAARLLLYINKGGYMNHRICMMLWVFLAGCGAVPGGATDGKGKAGEAAKSEEEQKDPAASYAISLMGGQSYLIPNVDTVKLKARFVVGSSGTNIHSASNLTVTINVDGVDYSPTWAAGTKAMGMAGQASDIINLNNTVNRIQGDIEIHSAKSDYYCGYAPNPFYQWNGSAYVPVNPLYNVYPQCEKAVEPSAPWSGTLILETDDTGAI